MPPFLLTVDTELYPDTLQWRENGLCDEYDQHILGRTPRGTFGLLHQLELLQLYGLQAVFFVEALVAEVAGPEVLDRIVEPILRAGQHVELHAHPEWLNHREPGQRGNASDDLSAYPLADQVALLDLAKGHLQRATGGTVRAFRAGNYAANDDTLRALHRLGIPFDSSFNPLYRDRGCEIGLDPGQVAPVDRLGVTEVPVTHFADWPGHRRHLQLCATSFAEVRHVLAGADAAALPVVVMVSHSFELVWRRIKVGQPARPRRVVARRFERLCRYLADHRSSHPTIGFDALAPVDPEAQSRPVTLASNPVRTATRVAEQLIDRIW